MPSNEKCKYKLFFCLLGRYESAINEFSIYFFYVFMFEYRIWNSEIERKVSWEEKIGISLRKVMSWHF